MRLYHAVGNFALRPAKAQSTSSQTHIYFPLVERLKREGYNVELTFSPTCLIASCAMTRAQAGIFLEMLTFGWFGANAREAMMLGKPVVCHLRPAWLESMRREIPDYVAELPIVDATPETAYEVVRDLVVDRGRREEIGRRSRAFALKWHSAEAGARRLSRVYETLLATP